MPRFLLELKKESDIVCISTAHGDINQLWDFNEDGTIRTKLDLVLDLDWNKITPGKPIFGFTKNGLWYQYFKIVPSEVQQHRSVLYLSCFIWIKKIKVQLHFSPDL
jgi:hypothetical protein